jgi:hypothetical protein
MHPLLLSISIAHCITLAVVRAALAAGIGQIIGYIGGTHIIPIHYEGTLNIG